MGMGVCGILTSVERGIGPETMLFITRIGKLANRTNNQENSKLHLRYQFLRWRFNVPKRIDTRKLQIKKIKPNLSFPWKLYKPALLWGMVLGCAISINLSLNSLLMNKTSLEEFFAVSSFTIAFILIFVFPLLIYNRIDARIIRKSGKNDFILEYGLRNRTLQIFTTVAVLSFVFHFLINDIDMISVVVSFVFFNLIFFIVSIIVLFLYYNSFEDDLAKDIVSRYNKIKD
jgi:hypothetical protein